MVFLKMKSYIFRKTFDEIFTNERLNFASNGEFDTKEGFFDFAPHQKFFISKDENSSREINIPDKKAKIIQKILLEELGWFFKFSDRNYAYQRNKSPLKAINRVKHIIKNYNFIIRGDIHSFFDSIDHNILFEILKNKISDQKLLYLLSIFIKTGSLFKGQWEDKLEGVYQGDVISPFLANLYLDGFDRFFEKDYEFVRFADDFIFFTNRYKDAVNLLKDIEDFLEKLHLQLNKEKTFITHKSKTFTFLAIRFDPLNNLYSIDNDRLMKKVSKISQETKNLSLQETIEKINSHVDGFTRYYSKIINSDKQFDVLQQREDEIITEKVLEAKIKKSVNNKHAFMKILSGLKTYKPQKDYPFKIIIKAYEKLKLKDPIKAAQEKVNAQKRNYVKNYLKTTELIVSKTGSYLSFSQGKIRLKTKNEPYKSFPVKKIKRVIITNKSTSFSNYLIYICSKEKIDIDFIDQNEPYAMLTYYQSISNRLHKNQLEQFSKNIGITYAKNIIFAKIKNQINLLKYFNTRRKSQEIEKIISKITGYIPKLKQASDTKSLMGHEGQASTYYWNGFAKIGNLDSFQRTHKNSKDPINQALNYGYAIIYNKIQSALLHKGLNIYYSFLHTGERGKPSLVFDMIEPFRQPVVDREILSIISRKQHLVQKDGRLDDESKKNVIKHIQERLSSLTKTRYGKTTYQNLIYFEVDSFKKAIERSEKNHKFFIAKY